MPVPDLDIPNRAFRPGQAEVVREGDDLTLIACGTTVHLAAQAADRLKADGISARVLNFSTINPLDEDALHAAAATGAIVTVEEASVRGGLGGPSPNSPPPTSLSRWSVSASRFPAHRLDRLAVQGIRPLPRRHRRCLPPRPRTQGLTGCASLPSTRAPPTPRHS
jgi:hypothetical protein